MGLLSNRRRYSKPYDYEVEYLEITDDNNLCYIDTGLDINDRCTHQCTFMFTQLRVWAPLLISNTLSFTLVDTKVSDTVTENIRFTIGIAQNRLPYDVNSLMNKALTYRLEGDTAKGFIGDEEFDLDTMHTSPNLVYRLYFGEYSTTSHKTVGRLYGYKVWEEDKLVADAIPVVRNDIGYMYDKVSHKLFGAQGGGKFIVGPKLYDYQVEYLELNEDSDVACIRTDCIPSGTDIYIHTKFTFLGFSNINSRIFITSTAIPSASTQEVFSLLRQSNSNYFLCRYSGGQITTELAVPNSVYDVQFFPKGKLLINDVEYNIPQVETKKNDGPIIIFANDVNRITYIRLHSFAVSDKGVLILDMIPVVKDGVGYMFDRVSRKLYGAEGVGQFKVGKRIN